MPLLALVFAAVLATVVFPLAGAVARRSGIEPASVRAVVTPVLWGASLPLAAVVLDTVVFWPTAGVLAALGIGVGVLVAMRRAIALECCVAPSASNRDPARLLVAVLAAVIPLTLLIAGWSAPSGDEPNYLIAAHSIAFDRDLDLADNYRNRDYAAFHPAVLSPHYRPGLREGSRYSMHGVGLAVLLTPSYALGHSLESRYPGASVAMPRAFLALLYGLFAWVLYGFVAAVASRRAAAWGTASTTLLAPLLFAPLFVFSEVPAMLLALVAFADLARGRGSGLRAGLALAFLPFIGVKYIPLAGAILVGAGWAGGREGRASRWMRAGAPLVAALAAHSGFTWVLYGSLSPAAIYLGAGDQAGAPALGGNWAAYFASWPFAVATAIGYLVDQKEGLLAYAPHALLAVFGLGWLSARRPRLCLAFLLVAAAYVGPYALSQQLGGQGPPVRPLMAVLWMLAAPLGIAFTTAAPGRLLGVLRGALPALSAAVTLALATQPRLLPHDYPVVASRLLQHYSPYASGWWRWFPQWVNIEDPNWGVTALWTAAVGILGIALWRLGRAAAPGGDAEPDGSSAAGRPAGWRAAAVVYVGACLFALLHHSFIVRTDLHRPTLLESGQTAWIPEQLPPIAFGETGGVWATPGVPVDFLISAPEPLAVMAVSLRTLVPAQVTASVQGASTEGSSSPGATHVARLSPGPGRADGDGFVYHARVIATAGASPADLEGNADERLLGALFRITGATAR